jgi:hypothetical protein
MKIDMNTPSRLPPVGCTILIMIEDSLTRAVRTGYIESKTDLIEYQVEGGDKVKGLFEWAYT